MGIVHCDKPQLNPVKIIEVHTPVCKCLASERASAVRHLP